MKKRRRSNHALLAYRQTNFRKAVAEAIAEHRRNRVPIAIWRDGKVVRILPDETMVRDPQVEYTRSNKVRK
jgi:hypothetical protein